MGPDRNAQTTQEANLKEWGGNVRLKRIRKSEKPGTRPGQTIEAEVGNPVTIIGLDPAEA